jgi:hypothetical protein
MFTVEQKNSLPLDIACTGELEGARSQFQRPPRARRHGRKPVLSHGIAATAASPSISAPR